MTRRARVLAIQLPSMFHRDWRSRALESLDERFDLIVVGGGITGCGIFLDAAQRGLRVLLLERADFASGTSSRSSKLIHGGLRYLRQMQFRVTRLACRERDRMLSLNPHLVRPIRFIYPARGDDQVAPWTVDLGLWMYDRLTRLPEKHTHMTPEEVLERLPGLDVEDLDRAMAYTDALTDDALLTLAVAATGFAYGGFALTRAEVIEATRSDSGKIDGVRFRDLETGSAHAVSAHLVINAAGVWVDDLRERFGLEGKTVRPSRGTHIVLPRHRLPIDSGVTLPSPDDGRPVFVIPHPEGVLVGTTDIFHDESLDDPLPTAAEVSYLMRTLQDHFPGHHLRERDIASAFAGLRPILDSHASTPSEASREEEIWEEEGMLSIAGGKLTTWRAMAELAVDDAIDRLPEDRARAAAPCLTAGTPLAGLAPPDLDTRLVAAHSLSPLVAAGAARRLRSLAWWLPQLARRDSELDPVIDGLDLCPAEVRVHLNFGAVLHLEDLFLRRARLGLWSPEIVGQVARALREIVCEELDWDRSTWEHEEGRLDAALRAWSPPPVAGGNG